MIIGAVGFGGGYGMIALMEREFVTREQILSREEFSDVLAISQSIPGLISLNVIMLVGRKHGGRLSMFLGAVGLIIPSVVMLSLIALVYAAVIDNKYVNAAFVGIRAAVIAVLINAVVSLTKSATRDLFTAILAVVAAVLLILYELNVLPWMSPIIIIVIGGAAGIIYKSIPQLRSKKDSKEGEQ